MILVFAMTEPGFESYLKSVTSLSRSHASLSVEIWKSISDDPRYQRSAMFSSGTQLSSWDTRLSIPTCTRWWVIFIVEGGGCMSSCALLIPSLQPAFGNHSAFRHLWTTAYNLSRYVGRHCPPTIHQALFLAVHSNSIQQHSMNDRMINYSCVPTCSVATVIGMFKVWDSLNSWLYHVCSHSSTIVTEP